MRRFSSRFLDNQPENRCRYHLAWKEGDVDSVTGSVLEEGRSPKVTSNHEPKPCSVPDRGRGEEENGSEGRWKGEGREVRLKEE